MRLVTYFNVAGDKIEEPYVRMVHSRMAFDMSYSEGDDEWSKSILREAQGNKMKGGDPRQAEILLKDDGGNWACLRETFAVSNVAEPLLALGKLLKKGWKLEIEDDEVIPSLQKLPSGWSPT